MPSLLRLFPLPVLAGALALGSIPAVAAGIADRYLEAQLGVARALGADLPRLIAAADASASRLVAGGKLYLAGEPGMISEVFGRAGGPCGALQLPLDQPLPALGRNDVILLSDYGRTPGKLAAALRQLAPSGALVVAFAPVDHPELPKASGGDVQVLPVAVPLENRMLARPGGERLLPTISPAMTTAQWTYIAELLGACRRQNRQLAIYLSTFLDPGRARYNRTKGLLFEPDLRPAPVPAGAYARQFLGMVTTSLTTIRERQPRAITTAAGWLREAVAGGKQRVRSLQGHLPPLEAGGPGDVTFFTHTQLLVGEKGAAWIREQVRTGDVVLFLGYRDEDALTQAASARGARTIAVTSAGPGAARAADPLHLHLDPVWPITDGCLPLDGYDVKACPLSTILNLSLYFAICGEALEGR